MEFRPDYTGGVRRPRSAPVADPRAQSRSRIGITVFPLATVRIAWRWRHPPALPDLVAKDKPLAAVLKAMQGTLNYTLLALVIVHAGAALKRHVVDRDGMVARMSPFSPRA